MAAASEPTIERVESRGSRTTTLCVIFWQLPNNRSRLGEFVSNVSAQHASDLSCCARNARADLLFW
jgi:hypothetical protein